MCGIAGFYDGAKKSNLLVLQSITDVLSHRGPDDKGYFFESKRDFNIGLGHRRLSIQDLSSLGHQPMRFDNLSISYNGEIYNFKEIRDVLIQYHYTFQSNSDTEVILKAFHKWGLEAIQSFNGMFAMALFNHQTNQLFLIRDRIGVKPLYYYVHNKTVVFSSELKSILKFPGFQKGINWEALYSYLYHGYIAAPLSIFENVYKLRPGHYIKIENGEVNITSYWSIEEQVVQRKIREHISEDEALEELNHLVTSSVNYRMIADAPIGTFLSGGYDSSLVSAIMQKNSSKPIKTFTIGFEEKPYNEADNAKAIARHLKTDHHEIYFPISAATELIGNIPLYFDEPFADSSQLPTLLVSRFAKEQVDVILSGDGGDELFCGYSNYDLDLLYQNYIGVSSFLKKINDVIPLKHIATSFNKKWDKFFFINSPDNIINLEYLRSTQHIKGLIKDIPLKINQNYFKAARLSDNIQEAHMLQDMLIYLPDDIMTKVDRATMSVSLEGREPLLDYRLFEFAFSIPHHLKYNNGNKKYLLKKLAHKYIPDKLLDKPKTGFSIPINKWLKKDLSFLIKEYLSQNYIYKQGIFDYNKLFKLIRHFNLEEKNGMATKIIWNLIVFQLWYESYIK